MPVRRAGASGADEKTMGAESEICKSSVMPYPNMARNMAPEFCRPVRPISPKSRLQPLLALVGVARAKTGPCPEALADLAAPNTATVTMNNKRSVCFPISPACAPHSIGLIRTSFVANNFRFRYKSSSNPVSKRTAAGCEGSAFCRQDAQCHLLYDLRPCRPVIPRADAFCRPEESACPARPCGCNCKADSSLRSE